MGEAYQFKGGVGEEVTICELKGKGTLDDLSGTRDFRNFNLVAKDVQRGKGYYLDWLSSHQTEIKQYLDEKHDKADHSGIIEAFLLEPSIGYMTIRDFMIENSEKLDIVLSVCTKLGNVCYVLGKKGGGKSVLAAFIAETIHERYPEINICYVSLHDISIPSFAMLYDDIQDTPANSFNVIDELSLLANARRSVSNENIQFVEALPVVRHSQKVVFGISQSSAIADVNLVRLCDALFIKKLSLFQKDTERSIIQHVVRYMEPRKVSDTFFTSYAYTGTFVNPLPKCWSDNLSRGFKPFTSQTDAIEYGKKLLRQGFSHRKVERYVAQRGFHRSYKWWGGISQAEELKEIEKKVRAEIDGDETKYREEKIKELAKRYSKS